MACISGLVVEYIVAIDVTRVRFPADAFSSFVHRCIVIREGAVSFDSLCILMVIVVSKMT